jgi:hypothetical protein
MILRKCRTEDDSTVHAVLIVFVLVVSALAGRQFFMDGTNFIVLSFLDPFWYPGDQETPRRFFAVVWTTAPVRLIGIFFLLKSRLQLLRTESPRTLKLVFH